MKPEVLICVGVVVIVLAVGLYFLLKKEKYCNKKKVDSATIYLTTAAKNFFDTPTGKEQLTASKDDLRPLLENVVIGEVTGPSKFIPAGYNGALVVFYSDGTKDVQPFGKTLDFVGNDLTNMYRRF